MEQYIFKVVYFMSSESLTTVMFQVKVFLGDDTV
jgi:hypothetical protein